MAGYQIMLSVTDIEPMKSYVEEMHSVVSFLHSKPVLNTLEKRMITAHDEFIKRLEDTDNEIVEPYLKVVRK